MTIDYDELRARIERAENELREAQEELRRLEEKETWVPPEGYPVMVRKLTQEKEMLRYSTGRVSDRGRILCFLNGDKEGSFTDWSHWRLPEAVAIPYSKKAVEHCKGKNLRFWDGSIIHSGVFHNTKEFIILPEHWK